MPQKPPIEPKYDAATGQLIMFSTGADGQIVANVQQVSKPQGKIETIYTVDEFGNEVKQSVIVNPDGSYRPVSFSSNAQTNTSSSTPNPATDTVTGADVAPVLATNPANITQIADNMEP